MNIKFSIDTKVEKQFSQKINKTINSFSKKDLGFYNSFKNKDEITKIKNYATNNQNKYDSFVVLGIGGSALGTKALRDALQTNFKKQLFILFDLVIKRKI